MIPPSLLIARYFAAEQAAVDGLEAGEAALVQQLDELAEEQGGEGGLLEDALNDKGKLTKASASARLKEIRTDREAAEERQALTAYLALVEQEAAAGAKLKAAQEALGAKVAAKYGKLGVEDIKALVVDDKWLGTLAAAVQAELDRVSQGLTGRVRELAERYAVSLASLTATSERLAGTVQAHAAKMGVSWK